MQLDRDSKALKENLETTQIIAQTGESDITQRVADSIGVGKVEVNTAGTLFTDITIKVGRDWSEFQRNSHK